MVSVCISMGRWSFIGQPPHSSTTYTEFVFVLQIKSLCWPVLELSWNCVCEWLLFMVIAQVPWVAVCATRIRVQLIESPLTTATLPSHKNIVVPFALVVTILKALNKPVGRYYDADAESILMTWYYVVQVMQRRGIKWWKENWLVVKLGLIERYVKLQLQMQLMVC